MADLARKKAVRGSQRAAVTRNVNRITELLLEDPKDPETITQLKLRKSQLLEKLTIIKRLDEEIQDETPEEEMDTEIEVADSTREKIDLAVMRVDRFVAMAVEAASHASLEPTPNTTSSLISPSTTSSSISPSTTSSSIPLTTEPSRTGSDSTPPTTSGTSSDDNLPVTTGPYLTAVDALTSSTYTHTLPIPAHSPYMHTPSTATHTPIEPRVKLPKIDLTKFDGDFTKWTTFWDVFESSVHMNLTLSKVDKFIYLRSLLESTAADAISGLSLSSANYDEAVTILRKRFGNKKLIIAKHMDALCNL